MRALITGIYGQDARYLSEFLIENGYEVIGTRRGNERLGVEAAGVEVVSGDVSDPLRMHEIVEEYMPDDIYNLAAVTHVGDSFSAIASAFAINAVGAANCLAAAAKAGCKVYQASTSELFGATPPPQSEMSLMRPRSPYACAKLAAYWLTKNYRERGVYAAQGILFNHESPLRGDGFVTQKIVKAAVRIKHGLQRNLILGNLNAERDWGHAKDYVRAMWMIMQQPFADDYVVATGEMRSVRNVCEIVFSHLGMDYEDYVVESNEFKRPLEVESLCGDASKIRSIGWKPEISFEEMMVEMCEEADWSIKRDKYDV